jgi:hypothetical protein
MDQVQGMMGGAGGKTAEGGPAEGGQGGVRSCSPGLRPERLDHAPSVSVPSTLPTASTCLSSLAGKAAWRPGGRRRPDAGRLGARPDVKRRQVRNISGIALQVMDQVQGMLGGGDQKASGDQGGVRSSSAPCHRGRA